TSRGCRVSHRPRGRARKHAPGRAVMTDTATAPAASLEPLLQAVPFACGAFARAGGALLAANDLYRHEFGALTNHDSRDGLLDSLRASEVDIDAGREVRAPHNGRWYALYWRDIEQDGQAL